MKRTIMVVAVVLGISATGFGQTETQGTITEVDFIEFDFGVVILKGGDGIERVIENAQVTVHPGESVSIHTNNMGKKIAIKSNGQVIGPIHNTKSVVHYQDPLVPFDSSRNGEIVDLVNELAK